MNFCHAVACTLGLQGPEKGPKISIYLSYERHAQNFNGIILYVFMKPMLKMTEIFSCKEIQTDDFWGANFHIYSWEARHG